MQNRFRGARPYAAGFLLPTLLLLGVCALCGVYPFGRRTLLVLDMYSQYMPFLAYMQRMLAEGNDWFYSLSASLGGNMFALGATYLFSPINALVLLFSRSAITEAILALIIVKVGLCGASSLALLRNTDRRGAATLVFSATYALMGYLAAYFFNVMWLDGLALLPLVALGIRRITAGRGAGLYLAALALALFTHYYIGYMLCIFSVLFFAYSMGCVAPALRERGWLRSRMAAFMAGSLAAAGLAAVSLLPTFLALSGTKTSFDSALLLFEEAIKLPDLFLMLMTGSLEVYWPISHLPYLFCGAVATVLAALYFFNRRIPRREKLLSAALMAVLIASFHLTALNLVWHAFNPPSSFAYRQSFLFSFMMVLLAYRCFARAEGIRPRHVLLVAAGLTVLCLSMTEKTVAQRYTDAIWFCAACGLLYAWLTRPRGKKALLWMLLSLQCAHLVVNGAQVMDKRLQHVDTDRAAFQSTLRTGDAIVSALRERDDELYRIDMPGLFSHDMVLGTNSPMLFSYPGITAFSSTQQTGSLALLQALGYGTNRTAAVYPSKQISSAVDSLLGVRYVASDTDLPHKQYPVVMEQDGLRVYENAYALPLGFGATANVLSPELEAGDTFATVNRFYAGIAGGEALGAPFVHLALYEEVQEDGASVRYVAEAEVDGQAFAYIAKDGLAWSGGAELFNEGASLAGYDLRFSDTLPLADYSAGSEVELLAISQGEEPPGDFSVRLYQEDPEALEALTASIAAQGASLTRRSSSHLTGTVELSEQRPYLLMTLPYDRQWRAWVDGRETEPLQAFGALMALEMGPGQHTFELRYTPRGFWAGCGASLLTLCALGAWAGWKRRAKRRYPLQPQM